jgi:hypothetical protein
LRGIRELMPAEEPSESGPAEASRRWNPIKGSLFAAGALVTIFGVVFTLLHVFPRIQVNTDPIPREEVEQWLDDSDAWNSQQLWAFWVSARDEGLPQEMSPYQRNLFIANSLETWIKVGLGIIAVGLLLLCCPLLFGGGDKRKPSP